MDFIQRAAVGFLMFALVIGVVGSAVSDAPVQVGVAVGLAAYAITTVVALFVLWVVEGIDVVRHFRLK